MTQRIAKTQYISIKSVGDIDEWKTRIIRTIFDVREVITNATADPLRWISQIKFEQLGTHPSDGHPLNFIEQVNQALTYLVALEATRILFSLHGDADEISEGFSLAPGANGTQQELDIMSGASGYIGAECFAVVDIKNNNKLAVEMNKLLARKEEH